MGSFFIGRSNAYNLLWLEAVVNIWLMSVQPLPRNYKK